MLVLAEGLVVGVASTLWTGFQGTVGDLKISLLHFAEDGVLMAPSVLRLQCPLDRWAAQREVAVLGIGTYKSEAMVSVGNIAWNCATPGG